MKWRLFRHLVWGSDPAAVRIYRWHISARKAANAKVNLGMDGKSGTDQYVETAGALCASMAHRGFVDIPEWRIPVDPNGELLGGAHRVACALALEIKEVPVRRDPRYVWVGEPPYRIGGPPWGEQWFIDHGMAEEDLERLRQDWAALTASS